MLLSNFTLVTDVQALAEVRSVPDGRFTRRQYLEEVVLGEVAPGSDSGRRTGGRPDQ